MVGPKGTIVNELYQELLIKHKIGYAISQIPLIIRRLANIGDVPDFYISYWFKNPADLASRLYSIVTEGSGNWRTQWEFKTGVTMGITALPSQSTRITMEASTGVPRGINYAGCCPIMKYWIVTNKVVPVPVGQWYKFEVFLHRSSGSDGRFWASLVGWVTLVMGRFNRADSSLSQIK